ncbi:hypothetical protein QFC24_004467 [Naganishia onofrii]|uniref:Uncharacterized protein n=1 Tax=Naganishia onofrii TaxID=1851511 RepID=A0ACC2XCY3_9TREE|nr:hypothetical protein QFC24_004467 [Naganishia onofrii]
MNAGTDEKTQNGGQNSGEQIGNREQDDLGEVMKLDGILDEMFKSLETAYTDRPTATQALARLNWKNAKKPVHEWDLLYQKAVASYGPALQNILGNRVGALNKTFKVANISGIKRVKDITLEKRVKNKLDIIQKADRGNKAYSLSAGEIMKILTYHVKWETEADDALPGAGDEGMGDRRHRSGSLDTIA